MSKISSSPKNYLEAERSLFNVFPKNFLIVVIFISTRLIILKLKL